MITSKHRISNTVVLVWVVSVGWAAEAHTEDDVAVALENAKRLVTFRQDDVPLMPQPVLSTSNPTRGAGHEGSMHLWLNHGRPAVAVAIFEWQGHVVHEVDALARSGQLSGESLNGQRWNPDQVKVVYHAIPDVPPPSDSSLRRQSQAKDLARLFSVTMLGFNADNSDREQLRLLPSPIYRYQLDKSATTNRDLIDGAVFAFVQATDPEALLIIEAVESNEQVKRWEYAMVRSTAGALEGRLRDTVVFTARKFPPDRDPRQQHFSFRHSLRAALDVSE